MFVFGIIGILVLVYFIFYLLKINVDANKSGYDNPREKEVITLNSDIAMEKLSEVQKEVVDYLFDAESATESDIYIATRATKSTINSLKRKRIIKTDKIEIKHKHQLMWTIVTIVGIGVSMFFANYYFLVRANVRYIGIIFYVAVFIMIAVNIWLLYKKINFESRTKINVLSMFGFVAFFVLFFAFGGRPYLHAEAYSELIEVSEADFINDISTVDVDTLPLVDKAYGYKLGVLKLGEFPGIGSEFEAGAYSDIIYQGQQFLVSPLEYRGVFKWLNNKNVGTPGYILINKITSETIFVNLVNETGKGLIYTPSAYLGQDLERHAYYAGMSKYKLENQFFEIDDDGNPYYILQYSLPTIFINGGDKINKIALVNATTGETNIYSPGEEPDWVDSVYPDSVIFNQLDYWGSLQDGWLNSVLAQKGVLQPSEGTRVIMNEGELYYFTGLTSAGNDESTIGFIYAGMKTKETKLFRFPGATEDAAMNKVVTLIPQNNISATFPIPLNVEGVPTYFIMIKGADGRILRYVYISIQDLEFLAMDETKEDAYAAYLVRLSENDTSSFVTVSGTITDITSYVSNGSTVYWVELDDDLLYKIDVTNFSDLELRYFVSLEINDDVEFAVLDYSVITITIE